MIKLFLNIKCLTDEEATLAYRRHFNQQSCNVLSELNFQNTRNQALVYKYRYNNKKKKDLLNKKTQLYFQL